MISTAGASPEDEMILDVLSGDASMPVVKVAKKVRMPPSSVRKRIRRMVGDGVIKRYTIERGDGRATKAIVLISAESASDISKISAALAGLARGVGGGRAAGERAGRRGAGARPRGKGQAGGGRGNAGGGSGGLASITSIYEITGRHDIVVVMSAGGIAQINETIDTVRRVPGVTDTNTVIILRTVL